MSNRSFLDSDVLIWHLRGRQIAEDVLVDIVKSGEELWMSAAQRIEVAFHVRPGEERRVDGLLRRFHTTPITEEIVDLGARLYRVWNPRSGTGKFDALLAATVLTEGGTLVTQNVRHYPMPEINVRRAWEPGQEDR